MADYHLAQINIARLLYPIDDPRISEFVDNLDKINALAEATEGYVWRLKTDDGNATSIQAFDDPMIILNLTVWKDIESLYHYTYKTEHSEFFAKRRQWFGKLELPSPVLWWIGAGHIPSVQEAIECVQHLQTNGASPYAFNFKQRFTVLDWENYSQANRETS